MKTIKQVLMERDGLSAEEAQERIDEAAEDLASRLEENDFSMDLDCEICMDHFGLEPDYFMKLLGYAELI